MGDDDRRGTVSVEEMRASVQQSVQSTAPGSGYVLEQEREAGAALDDAGWEVTNEGDSSVNLLRGELRLRVKEARFDDIGVTVEIVHDCVEAERADVPDLEPEQLDVG